LGERDDSVNLSINNFNLLRCDSLSSRWRCSVVHNSSITYSEIDFRIPLANTSINIAGVVMYLRKKRVAVLSAYRPPNTPLSEMHSIELSLSSIFYSFDHVICMGDLNIDLLKPYGAHARLLKTIMSFFLLKQIINSPMRITEHCSSLLDIILLSDVIMVSESGVCDTIDISDHRVIYAFINIAKPCRRSCLSLLCRNLNKISDDQLKNEINQINWNHLYKLGEVDDMVSFFTKSIINIFDCFAPLTYRRITNKSPKWLNNAIRKMIALKNRALSKYNGTGSANDWLRYKKLRNMTSSAIRQEKRAFLNSSITDRPSYDFWRNLTLLGGHNNSSPTIPSHLLDPHSLNNFFINSFPSSSCSSSLKNFFLVSAPII